MSPANASKGLCVTLSVSKGVRVTLSVSKGVRKLLFGGAAFIYEVVGEVDGFGFGGA